MPRQKSPDPPTIKAGKGQGLGQGSYCSSLGPLGNRSLNMDKEGMLRKPHPAQREVTCGEYTYCMNWVDARAVQHMECHCGGSSLNRGNSPA